MNKTPSEEFAEAYKELVLTIAKELKLDIFLNWAVNKIDKFISK